MDELLPGNPLLSAQFTVEEDAGRPRGSAATPRGGDPCLEYPGIVKRFSFSLEVSLSGKPGDAVPHSAQYGSVCHGGPAARVLIPSGRKFVWGQRCHQHCHAGT